MYKRMTEWWSDKVSHTLSPKSAELLVRIII